MPEMRLSAEQRSTIPHHTSPPLLLQLQDAPWPLHDPGKPNGAVVPPLSHGCRAPPNPPAPNPPPAPPTSGSAPWAWRMRAAAPAETTLKTMLTPVMKTTTERASLARHDSQKTSSAMDAIQSARKCGMSAVISGDAAVTRPKSARGSAHDACTQNADERRARAWEARGGQDQTTGRGRQQARHHRNIYVGKRKPLASLATARRDAKHTPLTACRTMAASKSMLCSAGGSRCCTWSGSVRYGGG